MNDFDEIIADLKQKRDELKLQIHLGSKEAKEEWDELEDKLDEFSSKAKLGETGEGVSKALGQLGREIKLGYERLWNAVKDD